MEPEGSLRVHKNSLLVPILNQMNPVHILTSSFSKIHSNIIIPSSLGLPSGLFSSYFLIKMYGFLIEYIP